MSSVRPTPRPSALALALALLPLAGCAAVPPARAADRAVPVPLSFADLADLALDAPVVAEAAVARVTPVRDAPVGPGLARAYVEVALGAVIRSPAPLEPEQGYLIEGPEAALRRARGTRVLLFARPVPGRPGQLQLVAPDAQVPWTPERAATVRDLLTAAAAPDAPPVVTGVSRAFHVPGQVAGEGETQLFLGTADGAPVSVTVLRAPGRRPSWQLALGDVVGAPVAAPRRDTLTWYRLACGLPDSLPPGALPDDPSNAEAARADYRFVRESLGPCERTRAVGM